MKSRSILYGLSVLVLRVGLVVALFGAGWLVYTKLPTSSAGSADLGTETSVQIVLRGVPRSTSAAIDVPVELYPIDIVAVRHEFFAERRAGERWDDFFKQRMKGRNQISTHFDAKGQTTVNVTPGNWWIHTTLPGDEELEWRLKVSIGGAKQVIELTPQNAYARTKSF